MSGQLLKASANALQEMYPAHVTAIRAGLLLAVCGRVKRVSEWQWEVKGQENHTGKTYTYHVTDNGGAWSCDCLNFKNGKLQTAEFLGSRTRHVCKHICAVCVCRGAMLNGCYPEPAANLYDTISNIVAAQHLPAPKEAWDIPGSTLKLARVDLSGRDVIVLQTGRSRSASLVTWVSNPAMPGRGMWHLTHDAWDKYASFIEETFGVRPVRSEPVQVSMEAQP